MSELTPKQEHFARLVAEGETYADAYRGAYNVRKNTKLESIWVNSSKLMADAKVQQRVLEIKDNAVKKAEITLIDVLEKLAILLNFNLKDLFNEDGTMKAIHELTDEQAMCIQDYQCEELFQNMGGERVMIGYLKKVKVTDRLSAIDKWMRKFGAYINTNLNLGAEDLSHVEEILGSIKKGSQS